VEFMGSALVTGDHWPCVMKLRLKLRLKLRVKP
jgi:hypothetical protein